jgi:hypothetical protein
VHTSEECMFHLATRHDGDGVPAGEYRVTFVWPNGLVDHCECIDQALHDRLKGFYAKAGQSTYQIRVGSSRNTFWFNSLRPRTDGPLP